MRLLLRSKFHTHTEIWRVRTALLYYSVDGTCNSPTLLTFTNLPKSQVTDWQRYQLLLCCTAHFVLSSIGAISVKINTQHRKWSHVLFYTEFFFGIFVYILFSILGTAFRNRIFHSSSVWSKINTSQIATLRNGTKHNTNNKKSSSEPTNAKLYIYIQLICIFAYSCKHKYSWVCAICSQQNSNGCQLTVAGWHFSYRHAQISDTRFLFVLRQRHHWKQP